MKDSLYEMWLKRNPYWETKYQKTIIDVYTDYGKGYSQYNVARGKIFGAGYEIFIIAFFIGLYYDRKKPLSKDMTKTKKFGQPIAYWGNIEARLDRNQYPKIRKFMFAALIAKTDIDLIALDKGEIKPSEVVDKLMKQMEEYANFGFDYMEELQEEDPNYFYKNTAFLNLFTKFINDGENEDGDSDSPEEL